MRGRNSQRRGDPHSSANDPVRQFLPPTCRRGRFVFHRPPAPELPGKSLGHSPARCYDDPSPIAAVRVDENSRRRKALNNNCRCRYFQLTSFYLTNQPNGRRAVRGHCPGEGPDRGRRPFRAPGQPLEPEDAAVHLRQAQPHPHHRPARDRPRPAARLPLPRQGGQQRQPGRCSSAPSARPRKPSSARPPAAACRSSASAGWAAP